MVFSKGFPNEVDSEVASMTVYKVVRLIGDELYSPYKENEKIIKTESVFTDLNGFVVKVAAPIIKDVEGNIAKTTDLSFVQYPIEEGFLHDKPSKVAIVDELAYKRKIKFIDYDVDAETTLLEPTKIVGMFGYTKGFVFSYMDYSMAVNSINYLTQIKLKKNIHCQQYYTTYESFKTLGYLQPEEYQYAIIECSIPLTHVVNGKTYKNIYVKTVEPTSTIATKFLKLEKIIKIYPPFKFNGNNIKILLNINPPTILSNKKIRIIFDGYKNKPQLSTCYIEGVYNFNKSSKNTVTIKSVTYKGVTYDDNGTDLIAEYIGDNIYTWSFKNLKIYNTSLTEIPFDVNKIHVFYYNNGWISKTHKIEYFI